MGIIHFSRKILISIICFPPLVVLAGCANKASPFGLIFLSDRGVAEASDMYQMPDSTRDEVKQLTFTPTEREFSLLVSPDGNRVVFNSQPVLKDQCMYELKASRRIYLLSTENKKLVDLTDIFYAEPFGLFVYPDDWSLDQKKFAIHTYGGDSGIMDFNGENKKILSIPTTGKIPDVKDSKLSPDGRKLLIIQAYAPMNPEITGWELLVYDLETGKAKLLADYQTDCIEAKWSPNSQQVAATCHNIPVYTELLGPDTVRIFSVEDSIQPSEHMSLITCREPDWSPDGKKIALVCEKKTDDMGLFVINSDGNKLSEVKLENSENFAYLGMPTWSPDGTQIIYAAGPYKQKSNIYCANSDGSNNRMLTNEAAEYQEISVYQMSGR
jgi:Tol biopolymer transport system component